MRRFLRDAAPDAGTPELDDLMTDACARMLTLETEKLQLGRRISRLAVDAHDPAAAVELRRMWARRRALAKELAETRGLLRELSARRHAL